MEAEKRLFLLENGKKIYFAGLFILIALFLFVLPLFVFSPINLDTSILGVLSFVILSGAVMIIFSGSAFQNLHTLVKRLPGTFVLEDFDPLRLKVEIREKEKEREKEKRDYTVLYHALAAPYSFWIYVRCLIFLTIDIPPEHYQIWTPLQGSTHSRKSRYDFLNYVRPAGIRRLFSGATSSKQREIVSDLDLMGVSHLHKSAQAISSLQFIGVAQEKGTPILLALLAQHADAPHLVEVAKLLETIAHQLETQQ